MKYSILMPYVRRIRQFKNTLESLDAYDRDDFEVILIEDAKNDDEVASVKRPYLRHIKMPKAYPNPSPMYNTGAREAKGEYIVITNPECKHDGDVLGAFDKHGQPGTYCVTACNTDDGQIWQGSKASHHRFHHFCSCIHRDDYEKIGGFDERFADGVAYDDDALVVAIQIAGMKILMLDYVRVIHQMHEKPQFTMMERQDYKKKWTRNRNLFKDMVIQLTGSGNLGYKIRNTEVISHE